jgi:uncharacterized protein YecE (DUF72 family)
MAKLWIGTTGWSHPDWVGPFYPVHLRDRPEAWLAHYATRFRSVEVSSSFDRSPDEDLIASWSREGAALQQRAPFEFSLKLPRAITHEGLAGGDIEAVRGWVGDFDREVLDPLDGEGLLGVVLAQVPPSLEESPENAAMLVEMLAPLAERRVALELRSPTWVENGRIAHSLDKLFSTGDICLAEADLPGAPDVRPAPTARHAYLRFHGRASAWGVTTDMRDGARYDYLYRQEELLPIAEHIREHQRAGRDVRCYFNNAPRAQAIAIAVDLATLVGADPHAPRPRLTAQQRLPFDSS